MKRFRKILVGVDLSDEERYVAAEPCAATRAAIDKALWLAAKTGAQVTFLAAVMPDYSRFAGGPEEKTEGEFVYDDARERLRQFRDEAESRGVTSDIVCTCGAPSHELIRAVVESDHDLVLVGSHRRHGPQRVILGSTGKKLMRDCPCPVWATSPHEGGAVRTILAATDFSEVSDRAVELAASLADQFDAELHIFHSVPAFADSTYRGIPLPAMEGDSWQARADVHAREELDDVLSRLSLTESIDEAHQHLATGPAHLTIQAAVQNLNVDLLVMGTAARHGLSGLVIGNTAERLLPRLTCSVLAVKPEGYRSGIQPRPVAEQ